MIGIYGIICNKNKRAYIGQSIDVVTRVRKHKEMLRRNVHLLNSGKTNAQAAEKFRLHESSISIIKRKYYAD